MGAVSVAMLAAHGDLMAKQQEEVFAEKPVGGLPVGRRRNRLQPIVQRIGKVGFPERGMPDHDRAILDEGIQFLRDWPAGSERESLTVRNRYEDTQHGKIRRVLDPDDGALVDRKHEVAGVTPGDFLLAEKADRAPVLDIVDSEIAGVEGELEAAGIAIMIVDELQAAQGQGALLAPEARGGFVRRGVAAFAGIATRHGLQIFRAAELSVGERSVGARRPLALGRRNELGHRTLEPRRRHWYFLPHSGGLPFERLVTSRRKQDTHHVIQSAEGGENVVAP